MSTIVEMTTIPPLHLACKNGNHVEAQYLIGIGGCNINDEYNGETPFMYASIFGDGPDFSLLHFLIENGANIDHQNKNGESSLSMAVCTNRIDLVKELLRIGANKYTVDGDGENMLHIASGIGSLQLVKLFISHGIGINSLSNAGVFNNVKFHSCKILTKGGYDALLGLEYANIINCSFIKTFIKNENRSEELIIPEDQEINSKYNEIHLFTPTDPSEIIDGGPPEIF